MGRKKKQRHENVSAPRAYVTAAQSLEIARKWALERRDHAALIDIANSWTEIGNQLLTAEVELVYDEDDGVTMAHDEDDEFVMGFTGGNKRDPKETEPSPEPEQD